MASATKISARILIWTLLLLLIIGSIYFLAYPDGPLEGTALTIFISVIAGIVSIIILGDASGIALAMLKGYGLTYLPFLGFFRYYSGHYVDFLALFSITVVLGMEIPGDNHRDLRSSPYYLLLYRSWR